MTMKKIYLSLFSLSAVISMSGQTLNQANNAPANGDTYSTLQCDSLMGPGPSGANALWNFSSLMIHTGVVSNYTTIPSTTASYPSGSQVTSASLNDQAYTVSSATDLKYYGGNLKVDAVIANLVYSAPATMAVYPMSLNSTGTSTIAGTIVITAPLAQNGSFTGSSSTLADGTGTLDLPGVIAGTYSNVIRVLTLQTLNFSTQSGLSGVVTIKNYNYYSAGVKAPMLTIATKTLTNNLTPPSTQSMITVNKDYMAPPTSTVSIGENKIAAKTDVIVFPNPAANSVNFIADSQVANELFVYDVTGKMIEKQSFVSGKLKLDVSSYNNGLYIYSILNDKGQNVKTGKLAVSH